MENGNVPFQVNNSLRMSATHIRGMTIFLNCDIYL